VSRDPELIARLTQWYRQRLQEADEVEGQQWLQRHWDQRLSELVGWAARRWL
jgi:hypothetical protein